jgi:Domain of unknown function (DUF4383)
LQLFKSLREWFPKINVLKGGFMFPKRFAMVGGIVLLALGLISLIPQMVGPIEGLPVLNVDNSYGLFANLFAWNIVNKVLLIVLGATGIYSASERFTNLPASIHWSRWVFAITAVGAILGLIPATNTLFGYMPLFGNQVWLHAVVAVLGAYFGFALTSKAHAQMPKDREYTTPAHGLR